KKRPASSSVLSISNDEEQDAGWDFIINEGERDKGELRQLRWIHRHINREGSPIKGWPEKLVQRALDSLANDGCLASLTTRYDLTMQDFEPVFVQGVMETVVPYLLDHSLWLLGEPGKGKTPLARTLAMAFSRYHGGKGSFRSSSDFDFFRGLPFNKTIPALYDDGDISDESIKKKKAFCDVGDTEGILKERWTAAKFTKHQLRIIIDNSYNDKDIPSMPQQEIDHHDFISIVRPAIGHISDADTRAILKRSVFIVFGRDSIFIRLPSERVTSVTRFRWHLKDILSDESKPRFSNYKLDGPVPPDYQNRVDTEQAWLHEAIRRHQAVNTVEQHNNMPGPNAPPPGVRIKMEPDEFADANEGLANMCNGEALSADSPEPPAPKTPPSKVKQEQQEQFDQSYARFLLASSAFSRALGPSGVIELSPSTSVHRSSQASHVTETQADIPNPLFPGVDDDDDDVDEMDVASGEEAMKSPPFPCPKRGKQRVQKRAMKQKYVQVPYVRHGIQTTKNKGHRDRWGLSVHTLLSMTGRSLIRKLVTDKILPNWSGHDCPRCGHGTLGSLSYVKSKKVWGYRCGHRGCNKLLLAHDFHPIFFKGSGNSITDLGHQAAALYCAVAGVSSQSAHLILDLDHKAVERIYTNVDTSRARYVQLKEKEIRYGGKWEDVEVDEVDVGKLTDNTTTSTKNTVWEQWGGLVERGKVVLHSDGARAYKLKVPGVMHCNVIHKKKKVKVDGKVRWVKPHYTKVYSLKMPTGDQMKVKSGTQIIDRFWGLLRSHIKHTARTPGSPILTRKIRSAQFEYWFSRCNMWKATGKMLDTLFTES
ncbi:unnamed protein product, partial [Symbiodinium sp. CCMP2592]